MARRRGLIASEAITAGVLVASEGQRVPRIVTNTLMGKGARQPQEALLFWSPYTHPYTVTSRSLAEIIRGYK